MNQLDERFYSPKELAEAGILCLASQWKERKAGRLPFYRLGRKVVYAQRHLDIYFERCENGTAAVEETLTVREG